MVTTQAGLNGEHAAAHAGVGRSSGQETAPIRCPCMAGATALRLELREKWYIATLSTVQVRNRLVLKYVRYSLLNNRRQLKLSGTELYCRSYTALRDQPFGF